MIVLLVFSVGVLAVLRLTLHNINTMSELDAKSTATLLAKEWLEMVYNTRDSNRIASLPWDCIANQDYNPNLETANFCKNHFLDNNGLRTIQAKENFLERKNIENNSTEWWKLFINTNWYLGYTHETTEQPTIFYRHIYFTGVKENENIINTWYLLKIESHVFYKRWSKTGKVLLEWFIWNY